MRPLVDLSTIVLVVLALALAGVAYVKDPGLPLLGAKNGFSMLKFILPRLVPALMLAAEVARDHLFGDEHLHEAGEHQRGHEARQDELEHREAVLRPEERQPRVLHVRDPRERQRQNDEDDRGEVDEWAHRGSFRAFGRHSLWHTGVIYSRRWGRAPANPAWTSSV